MLKKERYVAFVDYFSAHEPEAKTELNYSNPYELLVAVILSAQCTDKRINQTTPALFAKYPSAYDLSQASSDEVFEYIKSVSYPNNKAKHLVGMAKILTGEFNSVVPSGIECLQKMPGVGRKTANVISSIVYKAPALAVDTHVFRVSNRLGLTPDAKTPLAVEKQLVQYLPKETIRHAHHWLILHGRYICMARNPKCEICPITYFCKYFENLKKLRDKHKAANNNSPTELKALKKISADLKKRNVKKS